MSSPDLPNATAPETTGPGAVAVVEQFVDSLRRVLHTEPGWEKPLTMERLYELLGYALDEFIDDVREASGC